MEMTRDQFIFAVNNATEHTVDHIDSATCRCGYVRHWVVNMTRGTWNPMITEMDCELKGITTPGELYDFIQSKTQ